MWDLGNAYLLNVGVALLIVALLALLLGVAACMASAQDTHRRGWPYDG